MTRTMERLAANVQKLFSCPCRAVDAESAKTLLCGFSETPACAACPYRADPEQRTHQYGLKEAVRWGGSYIYYCPKGLTFSAFLSDGAEGNGLIVGPVILGEPQDIGLDEENRAFLAGVWKLCVFSPERIGCLNEVVLLASAGADSRVERDRTYDQAAFLNELYTIRGQLQQTDQQTDVGYILRSEEEMKTLVRNMDKPGVQKLLNELLGRVYLQSYYNLDEVKARCIELVVVLSRTVTGAGAEMGQIFHFSPDFLRRISGFTTIDSLCAWMSEILHDFIDTLFSYSSIKHADAVYKTMSYIRAHWRERPSLEDIASHVYLSRSYLSMLFKQETGIGISEFINRVRIEQSKNMLTSTELSIAAIASECCFHDQSYYTKVFQRVVGVSPKKYRDKQGCL